MVKKGKGQSYEAPRWCHGHETVQTHRPGLTPTDSAVWVPEGRWAPHKCWKFTRQSWGKNIKPPSVSTVLLLKFGALSICVFIISIEYPWPLIYPDLALKPKMLHFTKIIQMITECFNLNTTSLEITDQRLARAGILLRNLHFITTTALFKITEAATGAASPAPN